MYIHICIHVYIHTYIFQLFPEAMCVCVIKSVGERHDAYNCAMQCIHVWDMMH